MNKFDITDIYVKVCTQRSEIKKGNFLRSLTPPKTTRQRPFELPDIEYDLIKDEITGMECVDYNTSVGRNVMNVDDI